jgi:hypothetical protein
MNQKFVPFVALASAATLGVAADNPSVTTQNQAFRAVSSGVSAPNVEENKAPAAAHQPTVKIHREGDSVRRIQITCSCGQVIDLDCQY